MGRGGEAPETRARRIAGRSTACGRGGTADGASWSARRIGHAAARPGTDARRRRVRPARRLLRRRRVSTGFSRWEPPARESFSASRSVVMSPISSSRRRINGSRSQCTAARRPRGHGDARGARGRGRRGRRRRHRPAVLQARREGAVRALPRRCDGVRAPAVLRLRVRGDDRLRGRSGRARASSRRRRQRRRPQGLRHALGAVRQVPAARLRHLRRAGGAHRGRHGARCASARCPRSPLRCRARSRPSSAIRRPEGAAGSASSAPSSSASRDRPRSSGCSRSRACPYARTSAPRCARSPSTSATSSTPGPGRPRLRRVELLVDVGLVPDEVLRPSDRLGEVLAEHDDAEALG